MNGSVDAAALGEIRRLLHALSDHVYIPLSVELGLNRAELDSILRRLQSDFRPDGLTSLDLSTRRISDAK